MPVKIGLLCGISSGDMRKLGEPIICDKGKGNSVTILSDKKRCIEKSLEVTV